MTRDKQKKELIYLLSKTDVLSKERIAEFLLDNGVEVKERTAQEKCSSYKVESYRRYLSEFGLKRAPQSWCYVEEK